MRVAATGYSPYIPKKHHTPARHFVVNHNGIPAVEPERHRLLVHGMVERPLSFDLESLLRYPRCEELAVWLPRI